MAAPVIGGTVRDTAALLVRPAHRVYGSHEDHQHHPRCHRLVQPCNYPLPACHRDDRDDDLLPACQACVWLLVEIQFYATALPWSYAVAPLIAHSNSVFRIFVNHLSHY